MPIISFVSTGFVQTGKYKPGATGLLGYRNTLFNNYQRLNLSAQTNYYSPLNVYGFKFNFYVQLQASMLAKETESI